MKQKLFHICKLVALIVFLCIGMTGYGYSHTVWDALRQEFSLNHETNRPEVQKEINWLLKHPDYLNRLEKAEPYIYFILQEIKKRKLPGEIAMLPIIESAYDPFAYSGRGAAGLWQIMPGTGKDFGLRQDWWFDGRRSLLHSTKATLNYLTHLHKLFQGNWTIAFAAYNFGEGRVLRSMRAKPQTRSASFWQLTVPRETKSYIPRILALAEIIKNPRRYGVSLPEIPNEPYFEEVCVRSQIDLDNAAKLAKIPYKDLIKLNAGFNRWSTPPGGTHSLLIPKEQVDVFRKNLVKTPKEKRVSWTRHQVSNGESLSTIAKKYNTTVNLIKELNKLTGPNLKNGQYILIPGGKYTHKAIKQKSKGNSDTSKPIYSSLHNYKMIHIVTRKDTLESIKKRYHVSEQQIRAWNLLSPEMPIKRGQQLVIWKTELPEHIYVVKKGDSLIKIAKAHNIKTSELKELNPNINPKIIRIGQKIYLSKEDS